jgi:tellurite resistance protein TerC
MKEALTWSGVWIGLALLFNLGVYLFWDRIQPGSPLGNNEAGLAFLAGYLIEKALSVDNIFVFLVVFGYFRVPEEYQHRVLFWGIIGALVSRAIFIAAGAALLQQFTWMMIVFGVFLIATGIKMALTHDKKMEPQNNPIVRLFRRFVPVTDDYRGHHFFARIDGRLWATPLLLVLFVIEFTDVIFAVDSIPAIFAVTDQPFLVFTSNIFAILGLRALFFAVAGLMALFRYLSYGLAAVLVFVGGKMIYGYLQHSVASGWPKFPVSLSLAVIVAILGIAMLASRVKPAETEEMPAA